MTRPHDAQTPMTFTECCAIPSCPKCGGKVNTSVNTFHACLDKKCGWGQSGNAHDAAYAHLVAELSAERERGRRVREETIRDCILAVGSLPETDIAMYATTQWNAVKLTKNLAVKILRELARAESAPEGGKDG